MQIETVFIVTQLTETGLADTYRASITGTGDRVVEAIRKKYGLSHIVLDGFNINGTFHPFNI